MSHPQNSGIETKTKDHMAAQNKTLNVVICNPAQPGVTMVMPMVGLNRAMSMVMTLDKLNAEVGIGRKNRAPIYIDTASGPLVRTRGGRWRYGSLCNHLPVITDASPDLLVPTCARGPAAEYLPELVDLLPSWCFAGPTERADT